MIYFAIVKILFLLSLVSLCISYPVTMSSDLTTIRTNNERRGFRVDTQSYYAGNDERPSQRTSIPTLRSYPLENSNVNGSVLSSLSARNEKSEFNTNIDPDRKPTSLSDRHELDPNRSVNRTEDYNRRSEYGRNKPEDTKYLNLDFRYEEESARSRIRTSTESSERISFDRNRFTEGYFLNSNERSGVSSKSPSILREPFHSDRSGVTTKGSTEHIITNERSVLNSDRTLPNANDKSIMNRSASRTETPNIDRSGVTTKGSTQRIINSERSELSISRSSDTSIANVNGRSGVTSSRPAIRTGQLNNGQLRITTRRSAEDTINNERSNLSLRRSDDIIFSSTPDRSGVSSNKPAEPLNNDRARGKIRTSIIRQHGTDNNRSGLNVSRSIILAQTSNYGRSESNRNNPSKSHDIINYPKDSKDPNTKTVSSDSNIQFHDNATTVLKWRDTVTVSYTTTQSSRTNFSDRVYFTDSFSSRSSMRIPISYPLISTPKSDDNNFPDPFEALANMNDRNRTVESFSLLDKGTCPLGSSYDPEAKKCRKDIDDYD